MSQDKKHLKYKDYCGSIEPDVDDGCLYGKVLFISDTVLFEGQTISELNDAFKKAVNGYLDTCKRHGIEPKKSFKGSLNIRPGVDLHKRIAVQAELEGVSMNDWLKDAAKEKLERANFETKTIDINVDEDASVLVKETETHFIVPKEAGEAKAIVGPSMPLKYTYAN